MAEDAEGQVNPDFLLVFQEGFYDKASRRCWRVKRFAVAEEDDYLLVRVDPPMVRRSDELPDSETRYFILAPRWVGVSLFEIQKWPVFVNVLIPSIQAVAALDSLEVEDVSFVALGEIVPAIPMDGATHLPGGAIRSGTVRPLPQRRSPNI
jgi:hypothetical protein